MITQTEYRALLRRDVRWCSDEPLSCVIPVASRDTVCCVYCVTTDEITA